MTYTTEQNVIIKPETSSAKQNQLSVCLLWVENGQVVSILEAM